MKMKLTYPVTLTHHGAYKQYNKLTLWLEKFINDNWDDIQKMFQLPDELEIRLRPRPCGSHLGIAFDGTNGGKFKVELNVAKGTRRGIIKTLMHELRHIHQYVTKRLQFELAPSGKYLNAIWEGKNFGRSLAFNGKNMKEYDAQPWEADARSIEWSFVEELEKVIGPIPNDRNHD